MSAMYPKSAFAKMLHEPEAPAKGDGLPPLALQACAAAKRVHYPSLAAHIHGQPIRARLVKTTFGVVAGGILTVLAAGCPPVDAPDGSIRRGPATDAAPADSLVESRPLAKSATAEEAPRPLLKDRIERAVDQVRHRDLLTSNGFWAIFHGILGLGPTCTLVDPERGVRMNAIDYIADGGAVRGLHFIPTQYGVDVETGEMFVSQGHQDQFVAEMAQSGLPPERTFRVEGKPRPFLDFIRHSQMRARVTADQELSWTILAVGHYLGTDCSWTNAAGEQLRFEDLVRYEVAANIEQAACGGTHRLFGLQWVYNLHLRKGGAMTGVWKDLHDEQLRYQHVARQYQNPDGSFSTEFFRGPGAAPDMQLRMNTTGHIVEWLAYSLPESELRQEWMERAVNRLALMFLEIQNQPMESGTLYHALHGLRIYHERVFGGTELGPQKPFLVLSNHE
jgi:hypothetical protein